MKYTSNSNHFRIEESELLYMTLGEWVVSFEGYKHQCDNEKTLGPARGKLQWSGARLGLIEQCDFNSNDWFSPRYDFEEYGYYFDNSIGDYPFQPASQKYWEKADKYMLWEPWAWKTNRTIGSDWWGCSAQMEESVWKQLTDPYRIKRPDAVNPLDLIKAGNLGFEDLKLRKIYLYEEFDSKEEMKEAHKNYMIEEYESKIQELKELPYGVGA